LNSIKEAKLINACSSKVPPRSNIIAMQATEPYEHPLNIEDSAENSAVSNPAGY